jgi:hypothetical protein
MIEFASQMKTTEPMITRWITLTIYRYTASPIASRPLYIFETKHFPYDPTSRREHVLIPGADQIKIVFDRQCKTIPNADCLSFSTKDDSSSFLISTAATTTKQMTAKHEFSGTHFQSFELNNIDSFYFSFGVEDRDKGNSNPPSLLPLEKYYGWKFYVYGNFPKVNYSSLSLLPPLPSYPHSPLGNSSRDRTNVVPGVGLSDISFMSDTIAIDDLESFCFVLITKTPLSSLLSTYLNLKSPDDFTRRFSGYILCNLLESAHNCSYFLHLNRYFHYFKVERDPQPLSGENGAPGAGKNTNTSMARNTISNSDTSNGGEASKRRGSRSGVSFPNDSASLISLGYCFHQIMSDRYNRRELLTSSTQRTDFFETLKNLSQAGPIECKTYVAMCLANIAKESKENR